MTRREQLVEDIANHYGDGPDELATEPNSVLRECLEDMEKSGVIVFWACLGWLGDSEHEG